MQTGLPIQSSVSPRTGLARCYLLFTLNTALPVSLVRWISGSHRPSHASVVASRLTSSTSLHAEKGCTTEAKGSIHWHPYSLESVAPYDSDSITDTDSDQRTLRNVDSDDLLSSHCCSSYDSDSRRSSSDSGYSEKPGMLLDSHVFVFDEHSCTDDLDFRCAGEERPPHCRSPVPYPESRPLRNHPWSMPCRRVSWPHETHRACASGSSTEHLVVRPPRYLSYQRDFTVIEHKQVNSGVRLRASNKWGNNPPAGYI